MTSNVGDHIRLSKQALFERSGPGLIGQTGGESIADSFEFTQFDSATIAAALPSIETFVVSSDRSITATGSNEALNVAWMPAIERLVEAVFVWVERAGIEVVRDSYVTASLTSAAEVNGEAHFDDDQFDPVAGAGVVAVVGDIAGPRVASDPIPHAAIRPYQPLIASEAIRAEFAGGGYGRVDYRAGEIVVLPQFGQLHSGPGPCGTADTVRHLLVLRAKTTPSEPSR